MTVERITVKISKRRWGIAFRLLYSDGSPAGGNFELYLDKAARFSSLEAAQTELDRMLITHNDDSSFDHPEARTTER